MGLHLPTKYPAQSEWFYDNWRKLEAQMGHKLLPNQGMPISAMVAVIDTICNSANKTGSEAESNHFWKVGAFLTLCTAASLRGYEGFYLNLNDFLNHLNTGREREVPEDTSNVKIYTEEECIALPHVVLPLRGKFKGKPE